MWAVARRSLSRWRGWGWGWGLGIGLPGLAQAPASPKKAMLAPKFQRPVGLRLLQTQPVWGRRPETSKSAGPGLAGWREVSWPFQGWADCYLAFNAAAMCSMFVALFRRPDNG